MEKAFIYYVDNKPYDVYVTYKRIKNVHYRIKDGNFYISCTRHVTHNFIVRGLDKFARDLIKRDAKALASGDDFIYLLGKKVTLYQAGEITFADGREIKYSSKDELEKKLKKWFLPIIESRVRYYESLMGIKKPYSVRIRKMSTRYGSNSRATNSITFSTVLMHYTIEIIDTVIVHELAHHFVFNHSSSFYDVVLKYSPNYKTGHKKLRSAIFQ